MRVHVTGPASADIDATFRFLTERSPHAARATRTAIRNAILSLRQMPLRGRSSVAPGTREIVVPKTPYVIVYDVKPEAVRILRIRHVSQDPSP